MNSYSVVGFERRGRLLLGVVLKDVSPPKKMEIYTQEKEKINIAHKKIIWKFSQTIEADNDKSMKEGIDSLIKKFTEEEIEMPMLWELLDDDKSYNLEELVTTYFSDHTHLNIGSIFIALANDNLYFKKNNGTFIKNTQDYIDTTIQRIHNEKIRKEREDGFVKWFFTYHGNKEVPEEFVSFLEKTKLYALEGERANNDVKKISSLLGQSPDEILLLLENKEIVAKNINQVIHRRGIETTFSAQALSEVQELLSEDICLEKRRDISDLWNIAIDDEQTEEVDDAISYHEEDGLIVIGVHIADVSATIKRDSVLDSMAEDRFATVYFLDGKIPLFPMDLVKERLTLAVGKLRPTISGFFYFDMGGTLQKSKFEKTVLNLKQRATYQDSLNELGEDEYFIKLHEMALKIREYRCENGAVITDFPDSTMSIADEENITFSLISSKTPANTVVSEFMIYFNHILAQTMSKQGIPAFYRVQSMNNSTENLDKDDPIYSIKLRKCLGGATLSYTAGKHATLGLSAYTQGTSPIRRYGDLIIHRQFFHYQETNKPCYTSDELKRKIASIEKGEKTIKGAEGERYIFWFYKYLKQQKGKIFKGYVSRVFDSARVLVFFPEFFREFSAKLEREDDAVEGTEVSLRVQGASPRKQRLHLAHVIPKN